MKRFFSGSLGLRITYRLFVGILLTFLHVVCMPLGALIGVAARSTLENSPSLDSRHHEERSATIDSVETNPPETGSSSNTESQTEATENSETLRALRLLAISLAVGFSNTIVLMALVEHLPQAWLPSTGIAWWAFFCCLTLFPQSETLFFLSNPWPILRITLAMGLAITVPISLAAVSLRLPTNHKSASSPTSNRPAWISASSLSVIALYVVLYVLFGYFVAWQSPAVREYYTGNQELLSFWQHISSESMIGRVLPLQLVRGLAWAVFIVFLCRTLNGSRFRVASLIGLALAVWMNSQLLLPNPYMPSQVRHLHMLETVPCNLLFGFLATLLILPRTSPTKN